LIGAKARFDPENGKRKYLQGLSAVCLAGLPAILCGGPGTEPTVAFTFSVIQLRKELPLNAVPHRVRVRAFRLCILLAQSSRPYRVI
jgi:hypothetical protein